MMTDKGKILAVDDTSASLKLLTGILKAEGYVVRSAISGELALRAATRNPPGLILLDIRMPGMDGYEVCRRLKAQPATRNVPVIFVSAAAETGDKVQGFEIGAVDYVTKPYQRDELLARVRTHIELNRLRNHLENVVEERTVALRESEARYRRITEGLTDYQYTVRTENGHAVEATQSPACAAVTGYTAEEFAADPKLWMQLVAPEDRELVAKHVGRILAGKDVPPMEYRIIRKDGELRWVSDTAILFRDASGKLLSYDGVIKDITERKQAEQVLLSEQELRAYQKAMRGFSAHLQATLENEKTHLEREIHDNLGGTLTAIKMENYMLAEKLPANKNSAPLRKHTETMAQLVDEAINAMRRIITGLRPSMLDDLGLLAAIEWHAVQFSKNTGIECRANLVEEEGCAREPDKMQSINLFRIFQEALANVAKHSRASRVEVELRYGNKEVALSVRDNGCGVPEDHTIASTSFGILGMSERAVQMGGRIEYGNLPGGGFGVTASLPFACNT